MIIFSTSVLLSLLDGIPAGREKRGGGGRGGGVRLKHSVRKDIRTVTTFCENVCKKLTVKQLLVLLS